VRIPISHSAKRRTLNFPLITGIVNISLYLTMLSILIGCGLIAKVLAEEVVEA